MHPNSHARLSRRALIGAAVLVTTSGLLTACSAPGSGAPAASSNPVSTTLGSKPITLTIASDTPGATALKAVAADFTKAHPNVTVNVTSQDFNTLVTNAPRILAGNDVPDLIRLASLGNLVKDKLVAPLDGYSAAYGWDRWPQSQFAAMRSDSTGTERGTGSLYGASPGFGLTGVYYNKSILAALGGTAPTTLAEFESLMGKAHAAGYTGLMSNGKDGGLVYPLENLIIDNGSATKVQAWNFNQSGANIDTPATEQAASTLQSWFAKGYMNADANSIDNSSAPAEFAKGRTLFWSAGNWQAPGLDKAMPGKVGFILFPSVDATATRYAMTAPGLISIAAKSTHKDAAAAFLNFIQTDQTARQTSFEQLGLVPAGPADAAVPTAAPGAQADTAVAFSTASKTDGLVDFMNNATASISVDTLIPQTQLLIAGKTTPKAFATKLQSDYTSSLGR